MRRMLLIAITVVGLLLQATMVLASQGQVMKVIDGDTFMMEIDGMRGPETIEVNLRCSDAPILSAPFGEQSRKHLEDLLNQSESVHFKTQAYCGSDQCVEALVYLPDPLVPQTAYINTQMIAAGMARNDSCRGVFLEAETQAKLENLGIWSTSKKIVFTEVRKAPAPAPDKVEPKSTVLSQGRQIAPATISVDRAERTVTLKSREMSLSKAIEAIDTVSTLPVNLYLIEDQYIPLSLDKVSWFTALQQIVRTANLKQVNMNGKIDLYDQLFYYKHIAPYLKLSSQDGVYINVASGKKTEQAVDDGVTRYVFINEYENSAEVAQAQQESQHGYVQVHQGSSSEPALNHGRFEISGEKDEPATVATAQPKAVMPPPLKPYSGKKVAAEQKDPVVVAKVPSPAAVEKPVAVVQTEQPAAGSATKKEVVTAQAEEQKPEPAQSSQDKQAETTAADKAADAEPVLNIELDRTQAIILVIVIIVVVVGSLFLSRSAATRAAKAEKSVDSAALGKQRDATIDTPEPLVDEVYEKELFEELEHVESSEKSETVGAEVQEAPSNESAVEEMPQDQPVVSEDVVLEPEGEVPPSEQLAETGQESPATQSGPEGKLNKQQGKQKKKKVKGLATDEGNYAVTLDDYERLMKPPKREPRKDCLFEITCSLDGQTITGIGLDISSGGLFVDSKGNYAIGKVLELEFRLAEEDPEPIRCRCAVTWVNERPDPIKPNYPNGFGVCFLDMDAATRKTLDDFLQLNAAEEIEETEVDS